MGRDKAVEIAGESDLIEIASDSSAEADLFCPRCGGGRTVGGYLGDPRFRWCQICGARWRLPDRSAESLNTT
jgi:uncharacterized protein (DUF983 family)